VIRVLVVDDDFMVAKVHRGFVDRVPGFTTIGVAHTGADALTMAEAQRPDLVLLDIYLPDISGLEVLRRLREKPNRAATDPNRAATDPDRADSSGSGSGGTDRGGPGGGADRGGPGGGPDVLAVTAARDVGTVRSALHGGVVHYVLKPFTFDVLRDRLERYADAYGRLSSARDVAQSDVDDLFVALRTTAKSLPKGLTEDTSALIAAAMRSYDGDLSAGECAERIGLSRVSTRRYLEHFVETGKAEVRLRYGSAGRPQRRYRWIT
jgi:response regulator of citrate/malate metabolism